MKRLPYLLFLLLFITYFLCYQGVLSHVIYYHEQHHLFLFSKEYFFKQIHTEGLIAYLNDFVVQFFYIGKCNIIRDIGGNISVDALFFQKNNRTNRPVTIILVSLYMSFHLYNACRSFINTCRGSFLGAFVTCRN